MPAQQFSFFVSVRQAGITVISAGEASERSEVDEGFSATG
jgi:hypothetical protein